MAEHLTRRELKTDQFTLTVEHAADYFGLHRRQVLQVAGAVLGLILLGGGIYFWMAHARGVRQEKLGQAMQVAAAPVGPTPPSNGLSFATQQAKDTAVTKAFTDVATQYNGSNEGAIAEYTLAGMAATAGRADEARKRYAIAVDTGSREYASLAKLALAQLSFDDKKPAEGERLLRDLMDHPTTMVSKEQATISLARAISKTRPAEARALLSPLLKETGEVGQAANAATADIPKK